MWAQFLQKVLTANIRSGALEAKLPDGSVLRVGNNDEEAIRLEITDEKTLKALCLHPELALGEAYMDGTLTIRNDDLEGMLALVVRNMKTGQGVFLQHLRTATRNVIRRLSQFNPVKRSTANVRHHYDLTDELYELFLDDDLQYSCAYFPTGNETLEDAQVCKKRHIASKLLLEPGMRVLDIGSGWGGLGISLARDYGSSVMGVTLSKRQHAKSNRRATELGLADKVQFSLMDYRFVKEKFDRIVSVGMFEHVGVPHYRQYFNTVHRILKDNGIALLHTIGRSGPPGSTNPWITRYIFPGGYVPALSETLEAIEKEGLIVTDVEVWRLHYAETLRHWHERFMEKIDRARLLHDERFCRMWRFYLVACEMTFRHSDQVVYQIQLARRNDSVPLTRNYIYDR